MRVLGCVAAVCLVVVTVLLGACGSGSPTAQMPHVTASDGKHELTKADVDAWLDGKIPDALSNGKIPGAVVTVVHDGQVVTNRGYGYADTGADGEEPKPVEAERTLFRWASISKIPTSIAVMQLVEQGKIDLDADISTYVDVKIDRGFPGDITVRHLLTHTAGFEETYASWHEFDFDVYVTQKAPKQVFAPGTTPAYSNYGMSLAGYIVQQVSGERFPEYVRRHVLEPVGMETATYEQPLPEALASRLAKGYDSNGRALPFEFMGDAPAGRLTGSGADAGRFLMAQLQRSPEVLQPATWEQMWSSGLGPESLGNLSKASFMGLGYYDKSRNGHRIVGHGGDLPSGYHSDFQIYPDDGTGIFISFNGDGPRTSDLRADLMKGFSDRYYPSVGEQLPQVSPDEARPYAQQVSGTYQSTRTFFSTFVAAWEPAGRKITITATENGHLRIGAEEYVMVEPWVWQKTDGSARIAAQVEDGKVVRIGATIGSYIPQTLAQQALLPVLVGSSLVLVMVIVAWPIGALRRRWAIRDGRRASDPLPWAGRAARIGAVAAVGAVVAWVLYLVKLVSALDPRLVTNLAVRPIQVFQLLGVVAIIPAGMDLFGAVKRRAGWRRVAMASLLLLGLAAMTWWVWTGNVLSLNIGI